MRVQIIFLLIFYSFSAFAFNEENCKVTQNKSCVDYQEKIIDGIPTSQCWKYQTISICTGKEQNHCNIFEENRGCNELSGRCLENTPLGNCKHFEKKFVCGLKIEERAETKHVGTDFNITRDEKDLSSCSENDKNKYCEMADEVCTEGAETRNIKGKDVHKNCWKWDRKYVCRTGSFIDDCADLNKTCKEIAKECLHTNDKTSECEHWELQYQCSEDKIKTKDCIASKFCMGEICETTEREKFNDFGSSISKLSILASLKSDELEGCKCPENKPNCNPTEIDTRSCKFFTGSNGKCRHHTGEFNCCRDKGFFRDIFKCQQDEKDLITKREAKLCHHVGSWKGKRLEFFKKWQSHCCFKSKLVKIIQVEGRKQLGISWGDYKNPDCRALTLEELQRIDFSKIDFSQVFSDFENQAESKLSSSKNNMQSKVLEFKENQKSISDVVNKKISDFYGGKK